MEKVNIIWSQFPVVNQIAYMIGYASVFKDVITVDEIKRRLSHNDEGEIEKSIIKLVNSGQVVRRNNFLALPHLDYKIDLKSKDFQLSEEVIAKKLKYLKWIGKLPFIRFVGISGSIAAKNPVESKDRKLDIDVFVVTSDSVTWLIGILAATYRMIWSRFRSPVLCINHIWSESDLNIYNQNLYTAVEVWNMIPIHDEEFYHKFLLANRWIESYFPGLFTFRQVEVEKLKPIRSSISNKVFFFLFVLFRCLKKFNLDSLHHFSYSFDLKKQFNLRRRGAQNGGYQLLVQQLFEKNMKVYLGSYFDESTISIFFNDAIGQSLIDTKYDFNKLSDEKAQLSDLALNYSKYKD